MKIHKTTSSYVRYTPTFKSSEGQTRHSLQSHMEELECVNQDNQLRGLRGESERESESGSGSGSESESGSGSESERVRDRVRVRVRMRVRV